MLLSPLTWLLLALAAAWTGARLHRRGRMLLHVGLAVAVLSVLAMTPLTANVLTGLLEAPGAVPQECAVAPTTAVVLAGGVDAVPADAGDLSVLATSSRRRTEHAVAWWRSAPGRSLVMAGGPHRAGAVPVGALMAAYARSLGVEAGAIRVEDGSTSTWENARNLATMQPAVPRRVALVTSALHMRRARYALARHGVQTCPVPAGSSHVPFALPGYLVPGSSALRKTEAALHELVGMAWYRWLALRDGRHAGAPVAR